MQKSATTSGDAWHRAVPTLRSAAVTLREIKITDAQALLSHLGDPDLAPQSRPHTLAEVQKFARVARERHRRGRLICLVIIPAGRKTPVGLIQLRPINASGSAAEFEVVIGHPFQNDGLFRAAVALMFQFAFGTLGVVRLEARPILAERQTRAAVGETPARKSRLRVVKR